MPPGYVKTIKEEMFYEYAKLISRSAYDSLQRPFITDRFKKLRDGEITIDVTLGYFNWTKKTFDKISIQEQVEVLSLGGNIVFDNGNPKLHAHVVIGKSDATAYGGHLMEGHVRPILEVILVESPSHLHRRIDVETGLALITLEPD